MLAVSIWVLRLIYGLIVGSFPEISNAQDQLLMGVESPYSGRHNKFTDTRSRNQGFLSRHSHIYEEPADQCDFAID